MLMLSFITFKNTFANLRNSLIKNPLQKEGTNYVRRGLLVSFSSENGRLSSFQRIGYDSKDSDSKTGFRKIWIKIFKEVD